MTRWDPQIDLARLLEALAREILAASDDDVRNGTAESVVRASGDEVRRVIHAGLGDAVEAGDVDVGLPCAAGCSEQRVRQH